MTNAKRAEPVSNAPIPNMRIDYIDALRGFALLGIYWINITVFADDANTFLSVQTGIYPFFSEILNSRFTEDIVEGTMRGLFSLLFGASAMLFLSEAKLASQGLDVVDRYYRRALLLIAFGIAHAYFLLWPYDVLYFYGVISMLLFPIRKLSPRILLIIGVVMLYIGDYPLADRISDLIHPISKQSSTVEELQKLTEQDEMLSKAQSMYDADQSEVISTSSPTPIAIPSYGVLFERNVSNVVNQQSQELYDDYIFDIGGMMIIGIALFKLGMLYGNRSRRFYLTLLVAGYSLGFIVRDTGIYEFVETFLPFVANNEKSLFGYNTGRLIVTLGHVGLIGFLASYKWFYPAKYILVAIGRLALTNYIMQTVISLFIFYFFAEKLYSAFTFIEMTYILFAVWLCQIAFSLTWLHYFRHGPIEWLWRTLIFGKTQPLRHENAK